MNITVLYSSLHAEPFGRKLLIPFPNQDDTAALGGGNEAYYTYVEEADDNANKGSA